MMIINNIKNYCAIIDRLYEYIILSLCYQILIRHKIYFI
jgi:hypothetical protein